MDSTNERVFLMLKLFFWLLLIGNGVLFALQRGYVGTVSPERHEPQRLAQQLQPQTLTILSPNSENTAPAAKAPPAVATATQGDAPGGNSGNSADSADSGDKKDNKENKDKADQGNAAPQMVVDNPPAPKPDAKADSKANPKAEVKAIACIEIGNFNSVEVRRFDVQLDALNLPVKASTHNVQEAGSHMVYIPSQDGKDGADRRAAELRRLGIQDFYVMPESQANPALRWAISLGVFKTEEAAKAYIGQLIPQGVRSARIMARNVSTNKVAYQWRNVDPASKAALDNLSAKFSAQEQRACSG